ncbi:hypothetical protein LY90DRAFT_677887 [Neocallimastix californiae]|uniref:Type 1 phosphatases regulator n=1 Tax=Neocallimastix californiae TaxID=1754190 RepID=A0A1Y1ZM95_9FUNG|nr:hypothetical protein LY90DRAFT_677887 [Neocallimastix californiae]|eukprot:ORY11373.1 hypothetical protein LY90DRAFT_677887 [Neocallimastix californiae]
MEEENQLQNQLATATETIVIEEDATINQNPIAGTLILHGEDENERHVRWTNETIDNENMGKKKSKICCIYHKQRLFDESSSESSSDSDSDDNMPNAYERQPKYNRKGKNEKKKAMELY